VRLILVVGITQAQEIPRVAASWKPGQEYLG
jgi:hypothetical protein